MANSANDWKGHWGPLGGLLRVDWIAAARTTRQWLATPAADSTLPTTPLPRGVTATAGPGARLDWLVSRPIRGALGGRIVELYFRQLFDRSAPLYANFGFSQFRFDATKDLLRWTPAGAVAVSDTMREAVTALYDGLFRNDDRTLAEAAVTLGLARDVSTAHTNELVSALRAHMAGTSLRSVDFRHINLLSTVWRLSTATGKHGTKVEPDLLAVALLLATMTQTLRGLRATVDVGGAYLRAKNG